MDLLQVGLEAAFFAVFAIVLVRYARDRSDVNGDVVLVFGSVAAFFAIRVLRDLAPALPAALAQLSGVLLLAQPYLIVRLTHHFRARSGGIETATLAGLVVAASLFLGLGNSEDWAIALQVGYFVVAEVGAAILLGLAARGRIGNARIRLVLAAVSSVAFAVSILFLGAAIAATNSDSPPNTGAAGAMTLSRFIALAAGVGYLVAFVPPRWLRRLLQRAIAFDLANELVSRPTGTTIATIWERLAVTALNVTGGRAVLVAIGMRAPVVQAVAGSWTDPPASGDLVEPPTIGPARDGDGLVGRSGGRHQVAIPLASDDQPIGWLLAFIDARELFVEDDIALLHLLGIHAVRAIEREEAIRERATLVSELRETSDELARSRQQLRSEVLFRAALDAHPRPLLVADGQGRIVHANGQAEGAFGYSAADLEALTIRDLVPDLGSVAGRGEPAAEGGPDGEAAEPTARHAPDSRVTVAHTRDGRQFPVEVAIQRFAFEGEELAIAVLEDISERLEIEQLRDKFIAVLSHELRTPVTAIYGGSQLLLSRAGRLDPETEREILSDVALESERLHRLIENTLVLARIEHGRDLAGTDPVLIQRLLPIVLERERAMWPGTEIVLSLPPNLPTVKGDDAYIGQVLRNLVSNAAKYAGNGPVEVEAAPTAHGVGIRVLDRGPGIDPDTADLLFELYYRAPALSTAVAGAGIGLFVCRRIVHALGGRLWARPRDGGGAEFGFELPPYEADEDPSAARAAWRGSSEATAVS